MAVENQFNLLKWAKGSQLLIIFSRLSPMYAYIRLKTRGEVAWTGLCACCLFQVSVNIYCTEVKYIHTGILTIRATVRTPGNFRDPRRTYNQRSPDGFWTWDCVFKQLVGVALHIDHLIITLYFVNQHCGGKSAERLGTFASKPGPLRTLREYPPAVSHPAIEHPCTSHWAYCHTWTRTPVSSPMRSGSNSN